MRRTSLRVVADGERLKSKRPKMTRKAAKIAGRRLNMGSEPLSAYRCGDYWHLGHLPYEVRRGVIARASMTPAAPRRPRNEP